MPIKVVKEPAEFNGSLCENCFRCQRTTRYWFERKDVPCCPSCAKQIEEADVPTKEEWFRASTSVSEVVKTGLGKFLKKLSDRK
jgi:hypothetical protein